MGRFGNNSALLSQLLSATGCSETSDSSCAVANPLRRTSHVMSLFPAANLRRQPAAHRSCRERNSAGSCPPRRTAACRGLGMGLPACYLTLLLSLTGCQHGQLPMHTSAVMQRLFADPGADTLDVSSEVMPARDLDAGVVDPGKEQTAADATVTAVMADDQSAAIPISPELLTLSLDQAFEIALAQNASIRIMSWIPEEVESGIAQEQAAFDPQLTAGAQWANINQQARSTVESLGTDLSRYESSLFTGPEGLQDQLQLRKTWENGTRTRLGYGTNYTWNPGSGQFLLVNPAWNSGLSVGIEQPLLQGAGRRQNQLGILIAQSQFRKSNAQLRAEVHRTLFDVHQAYWGSYRQMQQVAALERSLEQAELILQREEKRLETGSGSAVDVAQARDGYESLSAELSEARLQREVAYDVLKRVLGLPADDTRMIVIQQRPQTELLDTDLQTGIDAALVSRAELKAGQLELQSVQLGLERADNLLQPSLSANASYRLTGLGTDFGSAWNQLQSWQNDNWALGLSFSQALGRRAERANRSRAETAVRRARAELDEIRRRIELDVRQAHREIALAYEAMQRQQARLEAAREQYHITQRMYETGQVNLDRFVRSQRQLTDAVRDEQDATVRYTMAVGRWYYVTGTMTSAGVPP